MTEELSFEVYGDTNDVEWSPYEWTDTTDIKDFEKQLIDLAEEQASWGVRLVGKTIQELWEEVEQARSEQEDEDS